MLRRAARPRELLDARLADALQLLLRFLAHGKLVVVEFVDQPLDAPLLRTALRRHGRDQRERRGQQRGPAHEP
jgi:hypothetical protein